MNSSSARYVRAGALLAINLLFLMVWGFAGISKLKDGMPAWFGDKFGATILGKFPGVSGSFWLLAAAELTAFGLALIALLRGEFLERRPAAPGWLAVMLGWSLFVFLQLGFGQWLIKEFNGGFQQFMYFSGTLFALHFVSATIVAPATRLADRSI